MNYLSVSDFTSFNPLLDVSAYPTTTLSGVIARVEKKVDNYLGYSLNVEDVVDEKCEGYIDSNQDLLVFTTKTPIISVSSLKIVKGTTSIDLTLTAGGENKYDIPNGDYSIRYGGAEAVTSGVSLISFAELRRHQFYTLVSYRAGWTTIPEDVLEAVSLLTKSSLASNKNTGGASRIRQGGVEIQYSDTGTDQFENDAYKILNDYKRKVLF